MIKHTQVTTDHSKHPEEGFIVKMQIAILFLGFALSNSDICRRPDKEAYFFSSVVVYSPFQNEEGNIQYVFIA